MTVSYEIKDFVCLQCGNCCRGPGVVRLAPLEASRIAEWLEISVEDFEACYAQRGPSGEIMLQDQPGPKQECIFLSSDDTCRIHPAKPKQCLDFPRKWRTRDVMDYCEGMRRS